MKTWIFKYLPLEDVNIRKERNSSEMTGQLLRRPVIRASRCCPKQGDLKSSVSIVILFVGMSHQ